MVYHLDYRFLGGARALSFSKFHANLIIARNTPWVLRFLLMPLILGPFALSLLALEAISLLLSMSNVAPGGQHFCWDTGRIVG